MISNISEARTLEPLRLVNSSVSEPAAEPIFTSIFHELHQETMEDFADVAHK